MGGEGLLSTTLSASSLAGELLGMFTGAATSVSTSELVTEFTLLAGCFSDGSTVGGEELTGLAT